MVISIPETSIQGINIINDLLFSPVAGLILGPGLLLFPGLAFAEMYYILRSKKNGKHVTKKHYFILALTIFLFLISLLHWIIISSLYYLIDP